LPANCSLIWSDSRELERGLSDKTLSRQDVAYAAAALSLIGAYNTLEQVAANPKSSTQQRLLAMHALPPARKSKVAQRILREGSTTRTRTPTRGLRQ
jgi:hypothetical protein